LASRRPPKQDKARQRAICLYDFMESRVRVRQMDMVVGIILMLVSGLFQYLCNRYYPQYLWGAIPLIGLAYGFVLTIVSCYRMIYALREMHDEESIQGILKEGRKR
jgi:hypothetical protein